ncbi:MAG: hypothetical protein EBR59_06560 [Methylococcaceae bacterium]|nr:hypothetical protein [Methylococcaceae bacterium]
MRFLLISIAALSTGVLSNAALASAQYPAANFQPKVIYSAEGLTSNTPTTAPAKASVVEKTPFDPRYPAAYFEPKVIYPK